MKRSSLHRFIPFRFAILVAPLLACWPQRSEAADGTWGTGITGGTWHTVTNWSPNTAFPGEATATVTGEGLTTDIAIFNGTNVSTNVGINMGTMGGQLTLGAIDMARTAAGNLQIGNNSTTNGILQLNGATVNSVANTLIRVTGSVAADLTIANVNTGTGTQTMGLRLGTTNGIFHVDNGRSLVLSSIISQSAANSGFQKNGLGTVSISGANTFNGVVTVNDGVLRISNATALGTGTSTIAVLNAATGLTAADTNALQVTGGITVNRNLILDATGGTAAFARASLVSTSTINGNANTWSGNITVKSGSNQAIQAESAPLTISGSVLNDATTPSSSVFFRGGNVGTVAPTGIVNLGAAILFKTDAGTWNFNNTTSAISGATQIADGTLVVGANNALSTIAPLTLGQGTPTSGTLNIAAGVSQTLGSVTVPSLSTGQQRITGLGSLDTGASTKTYLINDSVGIAQDLIISAPITGAGGITKTGAGTLAINSAVTGPVDVSTGRLEGSGMFNGGINLASGAILSPGSDAISANISSGSLSFAAGTTTVNLNVGATGELINNAGTIAANGTTTLNLSGAGALPNTGTVNLITHDGSFAGTTGFVLGTLPGRVAGNLTNTGTAVALNITGNDRIIWTGTAGAPPTGEAWDINSTQNWKLNSSSTATGFLQGDDITFDGTGSNALNVTLTGAALPARVEFTNNVGDASPNYLVKGSGSIGGATGLDKTGTGNVTLAPVVTAAAANTSAHLYTGATNIAAGTLTLNYTGLTGASLASATVVNPASPVSLAAGATLQLVRDNQQLNFSNSLSGAGKLIIDPGLGGTAGSRNAALSGNNAGFSGTLELTPTTGTMRTINAALNGAAPQVAFGSASIDVNARAQFWGTAGTYANNFKVTGVGYAEVGGGNTPDADLLALDTSLSYAGMGAIRLDGGTVLNGTLELEGSAKINSAGGIATINSNITRAGTSEVFVVGGGNNNVTNTLILNGDNSDLGRIWVNSGGSGGTSAFDLLQIGTGGTTGTLGSGPVTLHGDAARAAVLRISRSDGYTLAPGQTILGDVTTTTVADLVRTRLDLNVAGTGFDNAGNTVDLRDAGGNGGDMLIGNHVAGAKAFLTGTVEARNLNIGVLNTTFPTTGATVTLGKADGSATTTANLNSVLLAGGGGTAPLGNTAGATLNINPGTTLTVTLDLHLGEQQNSNGIANQTGGAVTVGGHTRIGHWPNATASSYSISGGTLSYTGAAPGTTPSTATGEATTGGFYVGVDGLAMFTQSGSSTVNTKWVVLDQRGAAGAASAGIDTVALNGGVLNLQSSYGIIARHPLSSLVSLDGGTIAGNATAGTAVMIDAPLTIGAGGGTLNTSADTSSSLVLTSNVSGTGNNITLAGAGKLVLNPNSKTVLDGTSDGSGNQTISANLNAGAAPVEKVGTGTTTLAGTNTYTGTTTISAGRLDVTGSSNNSAVTAAAGSSIGGEGSVGSLSLTGGSTLLINGSTTGALTSVGTLSSPGVANIAYSVAPTVNGPITVLNHGSTAATAANFALVNAASYRSNVITVNATDVTLDIGRKDLVWAGTTANWEISGAEVDWNTATDNFFFGDGVTLNDSNTTNSAITLTGALQPGGISVNSDTNQFSITGSAVNIITGATFLLKDGTSSLTINAPNTYTGGTTISEGKILVRDNTALGTAPVVLGNANTATALEAPTLLLDVNGAGANRTMANALNVASQEGPVATVGATASTPAGTFQANFSGALTLSDDVNLQSGAGDFTRFQGVVSGTGNVNIVNGSLTGDLRGNGGNRVILSGNANTLTGNITIKAGTSTNYTIFQTDTADIINNNANVTIEDNAVYRLNANEGINGLTGTSLARVRGVVGARTLTVGLGNANTTFAGTLEIDPSDGGSLVLTKAGMGTQILTGTNTYTGSTNVTAGVLQVGDGGSTGTLGAGAAVLSPGATLTYNRTGAFAQAGVLNSTAAGAGTLNVNGDATTALTINGGSGTFSGAINVNSGSLIAGGTNPWGIGVAAPTVNLAPGTTLAAAGSSSHAHIGNLSLNAASVTTLAGSGNYNGENFQLNGDVTVTGTSPSTITRDPSRTNADSGLALRGTRTFTVADVTGSSAADLIVSTELENSDTGAGGLTKAGPGTMRLLGIHSYTGPTNITAGTLDLAPGSSITASSQINISGTGIVSGTGTLGTLVIAPGAELRPGNSAGILTTGSLTASVGSSTYLEIGGLTPGTQHDQIQTNGILSLGSTTMVVSLINGFVPALNDEVLVWLNDGPDLISGTFAGLPEGSSVAGPGLLPDDAWQVSYTKGDGNDISLTYIPEPGTAALLAAGLLFVSCRRRKLV